MNIGSDFCIDSKVFKLAFDGGRADPYHIMERRGRFRGSLWIGITGLKWMLEIFTKLRNPNQKLEGFFVFHRDGYRVLEFSCLANRGGRFVEITEYHSGAHRGCIRIPEGRKGAGWSLFEFQVRKWFLGDTQQLTAAQVNASRVSGERLAAEQVGSSRKLERRRSWKTRKTRSTKSAPDTQPTVTTLIAEDGKSTLAATEPRPTRSFHFVWKPSSRTIQITLDQGARRQVRWTGLKNGVGLKAQKAESCLTADGPCSFLIPETQPTEDVGQAHSEPINDPGLETHNPMGLKEKTGAEISFAGCESELAKGIGAPVPLVLTRMDSPSSDAHRQRFDLPLDPPSATQAGEIVCTLRLEVSEDEKDADAESEPGLEPLMAQEGAVLAAIAAEKSLSTPENFSLACEEGVEGEGPFSPLTCTPIMMVGPAMSPSGMELLEGGVDALDKPTQWVAHQMNMFRKLVGVSIKGHETECLALLRKIEADRKPKKTTTTVRKTARKGNRELRNLVSSVNYGGKQLSCC